MFSTYENIKVTDEVLLKGALYFALFDIPFIFILSRFIKPFELPGLKWRIVIVMALFFCLLFGSIVSIVFWESVYR